MEDGPDRSVREIKSLLRKLYPRSSRGHKDRVQVLNHFRNYVSGNDSKKNGSKITTPEFYDDDLPLLFLGADAPIGLYEEDQYGDLNSYYGLLKACATPSTDHTGGLKRSARNAMNLLKYLVCDHVDLIDGERSNDGVDAITGLPELNAFAYTFCSLTPAQLRIANFDAHIKEASGNDAALRSGSMSDACEILVLLLTRHFDPNDNTAETKLSVEDILVTPQAKMTFYTWMSQNVRDDIQDKIKNNESAAVPTRITTETNISQPSGNISTNPFGNEGDDEIDIDNLFKPDSSRRNIEAAAAADRQQRLENIGIKLDAVGQSNSPLSPSSWKESALAKQQVKLSVAQGVATFNDKTKEKWSQQIKERQILIGRDPMGLRPDTFDLKGVKEKVIDVLDGCIEDLEEEIHDGGYLKPPEESRRKKKDKYAYQVDKLVSLENQKAALEKILHGEQTNEDEEKRLSAYDLSILPADSNFDPLLFLTIIHRDATYDQLKDSIEKLENKNDNHSQRIQELIRENFELFSRCADGVDLFKTEPTGRSKNSPSVNEWLDKIDSLTKTTSDNAKASFKPLLDNTNEVRKVQSALRVLQRVGPLLQVPSLMRQHIENGRFNAAVSTYRRVLVIDDDCNIKLLHHAKQKAVEAANDARIDLESHLASPNLPIHTMIESIKSLTELTELDIPLSGSYDDKTDVELGKYTVGDITVKVRSQSPSLSCLLLQAAHFTSAVSAAVKKTETMVMKAYNGEPIMSVTIEEDENTSEEEAVYSTTNSNYSETSDKKRRQYDILESRVLAAAGVASVARTWLPRLLRIAEITRQSEMRQAARAMRNRSKNEKSSSIDDSLGFNAFETFVTNICPAIELLVEHAAFLVLGYSDIGPHTKETYGTSSDDKDLVKLIRSPLPAIQTSKCTSEIAHLAQVVVTVSKAALNLSQKENDYSFGPNSGFQPTHYQRAAAMETTVEKIINLTEETIIAIERRKCIYAYDQCKISCAERASKSGVFDIDSIIKQTITLSDELTRPESCLGQIETGCETVVKQCCDGLASYVDNNKGDTERLQAVAQCASVLNEGIYKLVREVSDLTNQDSELLEEALNDSVLNLEKGIFEQFLESIRRNMRLYTKLDPMINYDEDDEFLAEKQRSEAPFPSYLSSSLLAIVRSRAKVERALGLNTIRKYQAPVTYHFITMSTAADSVVDGACYEISQRMSRMRGSQADQYLSELQFLLNTLKKYLSDDRLNAAENCKNRLLAKTGGFQGQGPDGLGGIERLERLGRMYVMCLSE